MEAPYQRSTQSPIYVNRNHQLAFLEPMPRLFSYVLARDYGFAPNPFFGYCTLANCKPGIRKIAEIGDWIIGTSSIESHSVEGMLVFAMQVAETISFNKYWDDPRFQRKKPEFRKSLKFAYGDNIYYHDGKAWQQSISHHRPPGGGIVIGNLENDTKVDRVLISKPNQFAYFGATPIPIPENIDSVVKERRGYQYKFPKPLVFAVIEWLENEVLTSGSARQGVPAKWYKWH